MKETSTSPLNSLVSHYDTASFSIERFQGPPPELVYLVPGIMPFGTAGTLNRKGGTGESRLALNLVIQVAVIAHWIQSKWLNIRCSFDAINADSETAGFQDFRIFAFYRTRKVDILGFSPLLYNRLMVGTTTRPTNLPAQTIKNSAKTSSVTFCQRIENVLSIFFDLTKNLFINSNDFYYIKFVTVTDKCFGY